VTALVDPEVLAALKPHPLARLVHFTPSRNLHPILTAKALRSSRDLDETSRGQYAKTDLLRLDQHPDHVCCSLQYPNGFFFEIARDDPRSQNYPGSLPATTAKLTISPALSRGTILITEYTKRTSLQVATHATCPVVVVRSVDYVEPGPDAGRVLVGVDGSDSSSAALEFAFEEASLRGCGLTAIYAWEVPSFQAYGWLSLRSGTACSRCTSGRPVGCWLRPSPAGPRSSRTSTSARSRRTRRRSPRWSRRRPEQRSSSSDRGAPVGSGRCCSVRWATTSCTARTVRSRSSTAAPNRCGAPPL
jgi:Universal stress protein family